jgi:hypothetical protein
LKPENIMIDAQGNVKIMDFGIARSMEAVTQLTGSMVGTPAYMAPEQVAGKPVDYRTDVYALGLIMYEIFTGKQAFEADNAVALAFKQVRDTPPQPHEIEPNVPVPIEQAILKCLEKDSAGRFQSIAQVENALRASPAAPGMLSASTGAPRAAVRPEPMPSGRAPSGQPGVSDGKKLDPFKPQQPRIPGVSPPKAPAEPAAPAPLQQPGGQHGPVSRLPLKRVAAGALAALIVVAGVFYWTRTSSSPSQFGSETADAAAPSVVGDTGGPAERLPVAPGPVATTGELANTWSAKRFLFRDPLTSESIPAMVVRLPHGEYWAFLLREPYGNCELEYLTDLQGLESEYHFRADHPMVGNPCKQTVYDLTRYGGGATNGGLVRGEIVQGPGIRPPMAIEIQTTGKQILAKRLE